MWAQQLPMTTHAQNPLRTIVPADDQPPCQENDSLLPIVRLLSLITAESDFLANHITSSWLVGGLNTERATTSIQDTEGNCRNIFKNRNMFRTVLLPQGYQTQSRACGRYGLP